MWREVLAVGSAKAARRQAAVTAAAGVGRLAAGEEEMLRSEYSSMAGGGVGTYLFTGVCTVDPR